MLLTRSKIHGKAFYDFLSNDFEVLYVGKHLPYKLSIVTFIPIILYEVLYSIIGILKGFKLVLMRYVSLDSVLIALFLSKLRVKIFLLFAGSDTLYFSNFMSPFIINVLKKSSVIFCSNSDIKKIVSKYVADKSKLYLYFTPVHLSDFPKKNLNAKEYDLITAGSINHNKSQEVLIKACPILSKDTKVLIVGEGPLLNDLRKKSNMLKLNVTFTGSLPHREAWLALLKSKVYVHTSKREGLPKSVLEAIYCKLPIIVLPSQYVKDLLAMGFYINVVAERKPETLACVIKNVLQNYRTEYKKSIENKNNLLRVIDLQRLKFLKIMETIRNAT
mgnify:CR=1 FL=1